MIMDSLDPDFILFLKYKDPKLRIFFFLKKKDLFWSTRRAVMVPYMYSTGSFWEKLIFLPEPLRPYPNEDPNLN